MFMETPAHRLFVNTDENRILLLNEFGLQEEILDYLMPNWKAEGKPPCC